LLISKFLITSITQRKANVPKIDFTYKIKRDSAVKYSGSITRKNGNETIKLIIESTKQKSKASVLNNIFFWDKAAPAENKAEAKAIINQFIITNQF